MKIVAPFLVAAAALAFTAPAFADNITVNQWYTGSFVSPAPSPLVGGVQFNLGTDGPVLPGGFAGAVAAPAAPWTITLSQPGTLTVTDIEASGDQFQLFDNGVAMTPAASPFTAPGQNPGQAALAGGFTSASTVGGTFNANDINVALGDANFSSGTFALDGGVNVITGTWLEPNNQGTGDFNFIAESAAVPEPTMWVMMLTGFGLVGSAMRRRATMGATLSQI